MSTPTATRDRLPFVGIAVALAAMAQALVTAPAFRGIGWVLFIVAAALFAALCKDLVAVRIAGGRLHEPIPPHPVPRSRIFRAALIASAGTSLAALVAFALSETSGAGWWLYALSVGMFLLGLLFSLPRPAPEAARPIQGVARTRAVRWVSLVAIVAFASILRIWQLDTMPEGLWIDEALIGLRADRLRTDPDYHPVYDGSINRPLHVAYLTAGSFALFGRTIAALRLVTAIFGILSVLAAYLLFDRLLGERLPAGLIAAAIVAVMRYDLTFSRIAFDGLTVPLVIMLVFYLLDYGLEHKGVRAFALAGLLVGLGLAFYQPMLVFVLMLIGLVAGAFVKAILFPPSPHLSPPETWRFRLRPWLPHLLFAFFGFFTAWSPLAEYALFVPSKFFDRVGTASIVAEPEEPPLWIGLWTNTARQLGMFHAEGDRNGRHNLPGAPLLDPLLGVLFVLGAGIAIRRWRATPFMVSLIVLAGMLGAGIFSASSSTPHALRAIGSIPVIVFFALTALAGLKDVLERRVPGARRMSFNVAAGGLLIVLAVLNLDTYFNRQMRDPDVRYAHSMAQSWMAGEMERLSATHDFYLSLHLWNHPTIRFLAPAIGNVTRLMGTESLPLEVAADRPLVLFLDPTMDDLRDKLLAVYPGCAVVNLTPSDEDHLVARAVYLSIDQLRAPRVP